MEPEAVLHHEAEARAKFFCHTAVAMNVEVEVEVEEDTVQLHPPLDRR